MNTSNAIATHQSAVVAMKMGRPHANNRNDAIENMKAKRQARKNATLKAISNAMAKAKEEADTN